MQNKKKKILKIWGLWRFVRSLTIYMQTNVMLILEISKKNLSTVGGGGGGREGGHPLLLGRFAPSLWPPVKKSRAETITFEMSLPSSMFIAAHGRLTAAIPNCRSASGLAAGQSASQTPPTKTFPETRIFALELAPEPLFFTDMD